MLRYIPASLFWNTPAVNCEQKKNAYVQSSWYYIGVMLVQKIMYRKLISELYFFAQFILYLLLTKYPNLFSMLNTYGNNINITQGI